jgi:branched-chain amino acid transport system substrate-binding protein
MSDWECSGKPPKYPTHPSVSNGEDLDECMICGCPRKVAEGTVSSGGGSRSGKSKSPWPLIAGAGALLLLVGGGGYAVFHKKGEPQVVIPIPSPTVSPVPNSPALSSGETLLIIGQSNPDADNGINAFKSGDFPKAIQAFTKAVQGDRTNPEPQIYLNNAKARQAGSPYLIAAVVPIDNAQSSAEEMLRGTADAQTKFNNAGGLNNRLVEVIIANDGNDPTRSAKIAQELANNPNVLGVIGHNASDASKSALAEYEKAGLAMISPTSTSTELKSNVFARTVPSDAVSGQKLAEYAKNNLNLQKVAVFYNPQSSYSKSLEQTFTDKFKGQGGQIVKTVDLSQPNFDPVTEVIGLQGQVEGLVLLPNAKFISVAIAIAEANSKLPPTQRFKLLGGDALYNPKTLTSGGNAVQGLTLSVPWVAKTPYAKTAENKWGGQVSWRTAMSFDAASALIKAISANPSRSGVLQNLKAVNLPASETSGEEVKFDANGDRTIQPLMVKVEPGNGGPQGSKFEFKPVK